MLKTRINVENKARPGWWGTGMWQLRAGSGFDICNGCCRLLSNIKKLAAAEVLLPA